MKEMVFQQKLSEKAYFIVKMTAPAMVRPVSSDKWKVPLDKGQKGSVVSEFIIIPDLLVLV